MRSLTLKKNIRRKFFHPCTSTLFFIRKMPKRLQSGNSRWNSPIPYNSVYKNGYKYSRESTFSQCSRIFSWFDSFAVLKSQSHIRGKKVLLHLTEKFALFANIRMLISFRLNFVFAPDISQTNWKIYVFFSAKCANSFLFRVERKTRDQDDVSARPNAIASRNYSNLHMQIIRLRRSFNENRKQKREFCI